MDHPTAGTYRGTGFPVKALDTQPEPTMPPPTLGQHTVEVLEELGCDRQRIETLRRDGVVGATEP